VTNLTYDEESRLKTVVGPGVNQSYNYNGVDTRVSKTAGGSVTAYHRDGVGVTAPLISDTGADYTPGVSERRGPVSTFLHGGIKDKTAQSDATQAITAKRVYDAYGMVTNSTGTWKGPFGYSGGAGYQEDETGLQLLGHRYYDASTGRFLTRDPIKDGRNWYGYCDNSPVIYVDATGLAKIVVYWYHVAGKGYHLGILVIDNTHGPDKILWCFAGGPERFEFGNNGELESKSGPWGKGTMDYDNKHGGGKSLEGSIVLLDDDSDAKDWVSKLQKSESELEKYTVQYAPVPIDSGTGNSNTWAGALLAKAGLALAYAKAIMKRGSTPWFPGLGHDSWTVPRRQSKGGSRPVHRGL
jgi:RHS repeat-associated protein